MQSADEARNGGSGGKIDMRRRAFLASVTGFGVALAGCSDSGDGGDGGGDGGDGSDGADDSGSTPTEAAMDNGEESDGSMGGDTTTAADGMATPTVAGTPGPSENVVTNNLSDYFRVETHSGSVDDDKYTVTAEVTNIGDQTTEINAYNFRIKAYNSAGRTISEFPKSAGTRTSEWSPDQTITINMETNITTDPSNVVAYEITVNCGSSMFSDGGYCADDDEE